MNDLEYRVKELERFREPPSNGKCLLMLATFVVWGVSIYGMVADYKALKERVMALEVAQQQDDQK